MAELVKAADSRSEALVGAQEFPAGEIRVRSNRTVSRFLFFVLLQLGKYHLANCELSRLPSSLTAGIGKSDGFPMNCRDAGL
jgi:hypothetical protein